MQSVSETFASACWWQRLIRHPARMPAVFCSSASRRDWQDTSSRNAAHSAPVSSRSRSAISASRRSSSSCGAIPSAARHDVHPSVSSSASNRCGSSPAGVGREVEREVERGVSPGSGGGEEEEPAREGVSLSTQGRGGGGRSPRRWKACRPRIADHNDTSPLLRTAAPPGHGHGAVRGCTSPRPRQREARQGLPQGVPPLPRQLPGVALPAATSPEGTASGRPPPPCAAGAPAFSDLPGRSSSSERGRGRAGAPWTAPRPPPPSPAARPTD